MPSQLGLDRPDEVLDSKHRVRCRGCGIRDSAVVSIKWATLIPIAGVGPGPVVTAVWDFVIGPAPSTAPPGAEGGDDNKSTAEAVVIKSVEFAETVEFAKMAVVEAAGSVRRPSLEGVATRKMRRLRTLAGPRWIRQVASLAVIHQSGAKLSCSETTSRLVLTMA